MVGRQRRAPGFPRTHPVFLNDFFEVITQPFVVISTFFPILSCLSKFIKILLEHENVILACKIEFQQNFGVNFIGPQH
jgi:hypothetical protein